MSTRSNILCGKSNNGSVLLSCATTLALSLIQPCPTLDCLPPRVSLITSADHRKKTKSQVNIHISKKESTVFTVSNLPGIVPKPITSKEQNLQAYPGVVDGIGCFPGPPYYIPVDPSVTLSKLLADQYLYILKSHSNKKLIQCYKLES